MLQDWGAVLNLSTAVYQRMSAAMQPAFFQLAVDPLPSVPEPLRRTWCWRTSAIHVHREDWSERVTV